MLYLLHGNNHDLARAKSKEMVAKLLQKKPDASFFKMNDEQWSEATLDEYIGGQGLFENKYIVLLEELFQNKEIKEVLQKKLMEIKESGNIFIIREAELDKVSLTKLLKNAEKVQEFNETSQKSDKKEETKLFILADALGKRDKKTLWTLYYKVKNQKTNAPVEDEQIHGILFWQMKNMIIASESKDAKEAGLNPFVFSKAKAYSKNYSSLELKKMINDLMLLYHEARRGMYELENGVERWVLGI